MRQSKTRAWDSIWNLLQSIHRLGDQHVTHLEDRHQFSAILDTLRQDLTVDEAHRMSDALLLAYELGKRDAR